MKERAVQIRSKAPLRLGLAGGGTDIASYYSLYGGYVLNATIDLYAYCTIEPRDDNSVSFIASDIETEERYDAAPCLTTDNALKLHTGVYNRIVREYCGGKPLAFTMTSYSDAPVGSGLGSSSTMVVAMVKAYTEYLNLPLGEYDIAALAYQVERTDLGLAGGKQDQYAATFGGFNFMEFYRDEHVIVNPLRIKRWIRNELENSLILYFTGVSRESAFIIERQIEGTRNKKKENLKSMEELKTQALKMKEAILKGDFRLFSHCLAAGWEAKKHAASGISNPFIDETYGYVMNNGAESAKISGAGGGGFMMIFCNPCKRMELIRALKRRREGFVMTPSFTEIGTQAWTIYTN
jgi:D-glycero-alpha-D-manno-heptose-7-phosphate kinase